MIRTLSMFMLALSLADLALADEVNGLPAGAQALLPSSNPHWKIVAVPGISRISTYERPAVSSGPILQSATTNLLPTRDAWKTYVLHVIAPSLQPGDIVFITGKARVLASTNAAGAGSLKVHLENSVPPDYPKLFSKVFTVQKDWKRFVFRVPLTTAVEAGKGAVIFNLGYEMQTVELCDVQLHRYPAGFASSLLPPGDP